MNTETRVMSDLNYTDAFDEEEIDPASLATETALHCVAAQIAETKAKLDRLEGELVAKGLIAHELREDLEILLDVYEAGARRLVEAA